MNESQQEATVLMRQLTAKQKEREQISNALLDETKEKDDLFVYIDAQPFSGFFFGHSGPKIIIQWMYNFFCRFVFFKPAQVVHHLVAHGNERIATL